MKLSLIICTYLRPESLKKLLDSILTQTYLPFEIIIVDGSTNNETKKLIETISFNLNIKYFLVDNENRGLTKQRNFGVQKVEKNIDIISFLDDDIVLTQNYFLEIISSFQQDTSIIGVGGIDLKENLFQKIDVTKKYNKNYFVFDGWFFKESSRNLLRKRLGLISNSQPDLIPEYSHGRSGLPPSGKSYQVDHFMGGIASYKKDLFNQISFSTYFNGYGLYEDFDFCVRASKIGKLIVNTKAQVWHHHAPSGRPIQYEYGKMVVRNGWYVWRVKYPNPLLKAKVKWHLITLLLMYLRFLNTFTTSNKKAALTESFGRFVAYLNLFYNKPKIEK
jgi:GT2 family glycosyltransferase